MRLKEDAEDFFVHLEAPCQSPVGLRVRRLQLVEDGILVRVEEASHGAAALARNLVAVEPSLPLTRVVKEPQKLLFGHVLGQLTWFSELLVSGPAEDEGPLLLVPVEGGNAHHHLLDEDLSLVVVGGSREPEVLGRLKVPKTTVKQDLVAHLPVSMCMLKLRHNELPPILRVISREWLWRLNLVSGIFVSEKGLVMALVSKLGIFTRVAEDDDLSWLAHCF